MHVPRARQYNVAHMRNKIADNARIEQIFCQFVSKRSIYADDEYRLNSLQLLFDLLQVFRIFDISYNLKFRLIIIDLLKFCQLLIPSINNRCSFGLVNAQIELVDRDALHGVPNNLRCEYGHQWEGVRDVPPADPHNENINHKSHAVCKT